MARLQRSQLPQRDPRTAIPLSEQAFYVLLALVDGERHGYAIMQDVDERTSGTLKLGAGTLYGLLKRLLAAGIVVETDERPDPDLDDERRRYYCLTPFGAAVLAAETRRLEELVRHARRKRAGIDAGARGLKPRPA
jgi:DNA-binding PadR family transcriptional regulator